MAPGVSVRPGATALQRIPCVPYWEATDFVSSTTPALQAPYAARTPRPTKPSIDAVFTIEPPPRASMAGIACLHPRNWPFKLTATRRSKTDMSRVAMSVSTAFRDESVALLCRTSSPPNDCDSSLDHARDGRFVRNVDLDWHRLIELPGNAFCFGSVEVGNKNQRALTCHDPRRRLTDPAPSAGDNRHLAVQPPHSPSMSAAVSSGRCPFGSPSST